MMICITEQFKTRSYVKIRQHTKILIDLDNETKDSEKGWNTCKLCNVFSMT